jgi:adenylate cyclase
MSKPEDKEDTAQLWRDWFMTGNVPGVRRTRQLNALLPSSPRCKLCNAPFGGIGGRIMRITAGIRPSTMNPRFCSACEDMIRLHHAGAEVEMAMLFADVRGSTALSERLSPTEFSRLINRFYKEATQAIIETDGLVDKLAGDAVAGFWGAGIAGPDYVARTVEAAQHLLKATGHANPGGPWIPVGIGVHAGVAYFGVMGGPGGLTDLTALGEEVNTAARLGSAAATGEIVVSEKALAATTIDPSPYEARSLELKGLSEPVAVRVLRV